MGPVSWILFFVSKNLFRRKISARSVCVGEPWRLMFFAQVRGQFIYQVVDHDEGYRELAINVVRAGRVGPAFAFPGGLFVAFVRGNWFIFHVVSFDVFVDFVVKTVYAFACFISVTNA